MDRIRRRAATRVIIPMGIAAIILVIAALVAARAVAPEAWPPLLASLRLAGWATIGALPLGLLLALLLAKTDIVGRRLLWLVTAAMLFTPIYLQAAAWEAGFGRLGWYTLMNDQMAAPLLTSWRAAIWIHIVAAAPWVTVIVAAALKYVDAEQEEAARMDGGLRGALMHVVAPHLLAALGAAAIWVFVTTAAEMTVADLFFIPTFGRELYNSFGMGDTPAEVWRFAWPGFALTAALALAAAACLAYLSPLGLSLTTRSATPYALGRWRPAASLLAFTLVLFLTAAPLVNLCVKAGWVAEVAATDRARSWSATRFVETVVGSPWRFREELSWSIAIGAVAATATIAVAAPLALWGRRGDWRSVPLALLSAVSLATPGPLFALAMVSVFSRDLGPINSLYDRTIFAPVLATAFRAFPFAAVILWIGFRSLDERVLESSQLDGAGFGGRLLRVAAPLRGSLVIVAWLVVFAIASGDLSSTILVAPPGVTTAAIRVFGLIHSGVRYQESGLCLAALGLYFLAAVAAAVVHRGLGRER